MTTTTFKAELENLEHLTRDERTCVKSIANTINDSTKTTTWDAAAGWLACLSGWFVYRGGGHLSLSKGNGDSRRIMLVTELHPTMTYNPPTKAQSGKRFFVIAQRYSNLKVIVFGTNRDEVAKRFNTHFANRHELTAIEFGEAVCHVSRYGRVEWGCFEQLKIEANA